MKFNHNFSSRFRILSKGRVVLAISVVASNLLYAASEQNALPTNPVIVSGNIGISSSAPNNLTVNQTTNKGIINWDTFNIGSAANVKFNQPNVNSSTLNRVVGSELSQIAGTLNANGKVILINPNGVVFSKGSRVDVGGIVASTLDLSDENYLNDNYTFTRDGSNGKVLNYGEIIAQDKGFVALLAPEVINEGVVIARAGSVAFSAGDKVTLDFSGDGLLQVEVEASTIDTLIENKNLVIADSGIVYMSTKAASQLQNSTISNSGTIQANSIQEVGGKIILTADTITLEENSVIEAKGATGGGEVLIGGDWQGSNDVYQATTVTMEKGATIDASATENGDGGKIVVWSDVSNKNSLTDVSGATLDARGGVDGGDGGKIETSGHDIDLTDTIVLAGAPKGANGLWLIDPDTTLGSGQVASINSALSGSTNVTYYAQYGHLTLTDSIYINKAGGGTSTLTLKVDGNVVIGSGVTIDATSGVLNLNIWSDFDNDDSGAVHIKDSSSIKTNGGDIYIGGGSSLIADYADNSGEIFQGVLIDKAVLNAEGGNISIRGSTDSSTDEWGVVIQEGTTLTTSGNGNIRISGKSSSSGQNPYGVLLRSTGTAITAQNGNIYITGEGLGSGNTRGVVLENNSKVSVTGSGEINIYGTADSKVGLYLKDNSSLYNASGQITINTDALGMDSATRISSNGLSQSELTVKPTTSGRNIDIGSTTNNSLNIPSNYLSTNFQNGFKKITIGSTSSGYLSIGSDFSFNDSLSLISGNDINTVSAYSTITGNNNDLTLSSNNYIFFGHTVNMGSGSLIKEGSGTLSNSISGGNHTYSNLYINNGTVQMTADKFSAATNVYVASDAEWTSVGSGTIGTISGGGNIQNVDNLTLASPNGETFSGTLSSSSSGSTLTKNGTGTFTLSGDNSSFQGEIFVNAGTLIASNSGALGTSTYETRVASGATLDVRANIGAEPIVLNGGTLSTPTDSFDLSGAITLGANSIISVGNLMQLRLFGVIDDGSGTYGITKTGNGNITLAGSNTYGGATNIDAGSLLLRYSNVIPDTSAVSLASGTNFYMSNYNDTIGSLSGAGNVNLGSGTLTISTGGTTFSGAIHGSGNLVKDGTGTFTLSGNNSYTGTTTINDGSLQIGAGSTTGTLGTGNIILSGSSILKFNRSGSLTVANNISGDGYLSKDGLSTLTLSGNNSYTKTTIINGGELIVTSNTGLGATGFAGRTSIVNGALDLKNVSVGDEYISIALGGTLKTSSGTSSLTGDVNVGTSIVIDVSSGAQLTLSGKLDDGDTLLPQSTSKNGAGTLIITNNTNDYGSTVINAGTLQVGNGGTTGVLGGGDVTNNGILIFNRNNTLTFDKIVSGTGNVIQQGSGTTTLSGENTYTGTTTINNGILQAGVNNALSNATAVTVASGTYDLNNYSDTIGSLSGSGSVTLGSGTLTTGASNSTTTFSGVISETGNLVKTGTGTFTLSGNNTYNGSTTINDGTIKLGKTNALPTNTTLSMTGGDNDLRLDLTDSYDQTIGSLSGSGRIYLYGRTLTTGENSTSTTFSGVMSGSTGGNLVKNGSGTFTLSGTNIYTGSTTINNGTIKLGKTDALPTNTALFMTGGDNDLRLDLTDSYDQTIGSLSGSGRIYLYDQTLTTGGKNTSTTFSGVMSGGTGGSLVKNGSGTFVLTGNNLYTGSTTISSGTLQVGSGGTTGKLGTGDVISNSRLVINRSDSISLSDIVSSPITGTGDVTAVIGGNFDVNKDITLSGANSKIILAAGYNTAAGTESGGDVTLTNTVTTSNTGTVTIFQGNANTSTLNSKIVGATDATKYKTYNVNNTAISGAVSGTRNFYYRADPKLTISDLTASKVYDGNTDATTSLLGGTVAGNIDGDVYTIPNLSLSSAIYNSKDAGSRTLSASYTASALTASGYNVSGYTVDAYSGTGTISQKTVTLSGAKIYNGNTVLGIGEVAISTGIGSETLTFSAATVNDAHVVTAGKYINAITLQDGTNGGVASNYQLPTLDATNAAVTISAKTLTSTISNTGVSKIYDGTIGASFTPTYTYSGFVTGDSDATINNSSMIYNNSHVASANKITVSGLSIGSIIGNNSSLASDYILDSASKDVSVTITPATLTSTISNTNVTKIYDGTTAAPAGFTPTYNITGFVSGDTVSTITNTGSIYDDAHVLTASKIIVSGMAVGTITGDKGSQASDYVLDASSKEVSAVITPKSLTPVISSVSVSKTYDGTIDGTSTLYYSYDGTSFNGQTGSGLIGGDSNAALTYASYIYDSKDAGVASKVTVSGLQIDAISGSNGSIASDYSLTTNILEQNGSIGKKVVTLAASKVYDSNTNLTNAVVINTGVAGEELAYSNAAAGSAHVSNNAFNQINSITLENNGAVLASNYKLPTLNFANAPVTISAASLTAILNNIGVTKVYDGTINTPTGFIPTYTITGYVSGDSAATISNTAQAYNDAHVLTANKVGVSGMSITGITGSNSSETTDYVLSSNSSETTATITPATLTPTISNTGVTKVYDGTTNAPIGFVPTYTYSGLVSGDTNATLSHIANVYNDKDVLDANKITVSGLSVTSITGNKSSVSSDYILDATSKNVAAVITPKTLSLAASKVYDGSINLIGPAVTILTNVGSETLSYSGATANDANVLTANKYIDAITLLNGANGGIVSNYKLPTLNNIFAPVTITPASLIISANSFNKAYDAIPYFGGNGVAYKGFVGTETPSILNGSLAYRGNSQSAVNSGIYAITPYGLSNSNYNIKFTDGSLIIDPQKVIPIPTVPNPISPPIAQPANNGTNTSDIQTSNVNEISKPLSTPSSNNSTANSTAVIQEQQVDGSVTFDGMVVGSTQTGDDVKAIIIQGTASSKIPFTLLVNVKVAEGFKFDIPMDIVNQISNIDTTNNSKLAVNVTLSDGNELPSWLKFDENTMSFSSTNVPAGSFPLSANLKIGTGVNSKTIEVIIK